MARTIREELAKPPVRGCERFVLARTGLSTLDGQHVLLLRGAEPIPEDSYFMHPSGSAWSPRVTTEFLSSAAVLRSGLVLIHSHPYSNKPGLSATDRRSLGGLLPACQAHVPVQPHGSLVLGEDSKLGGLIWLPGHPPSELVEVSAAEWCGMPRIVRPEPAITDALARTRFDRLQPIIGTGGLAALQRSTVGVVGLCGGGSHVVQQLAHLGIGSLVIVDDETVEETNLTRMVGATTADIRHPKVDVMEKLVGGIDSEIRVRKVQETFPSKRGMEALKGCCAVVSCLDSYAARDEVMKFAWRHLLPVVDIGMTAIPTETRAFGADAVCGHMCFYHPGGPCMWCADQLSTAKLEAERAQDGESYVRGMAAPQVVSFNGLLASWAVIELMQYLTGFMPRTDAPTSRGFMIYDGVARSIHALEPTRKGSCRLCNFELGAGDPTW